MSLPAELTAATGQLPSALQTLRDFIRYAASRFAGADLFYGHGTDNPHDEAVNLVLDSLGLDHSKADFLLDARLLEDERSLLWERISRRVEQRVPLPYLTGIAWFAGLPFRVTRDVLIPRSPIAELLANDCQPWRGEGSVDRILDLCAGSGCIGIVAALHYPEAAIDLVELDPAAIEVARQNIARFELAERVQAIQGDLFASLAGQRYHLILANPPYVDAGDMASLPPEYRHEPELALASGDDGLDICRRILADAADHLAPGGLLVLEVGNSQEHLEQAFPHLPVTWVDFVAGGHGVMVISREQLTGDC